MNVLAVDAIVDLNEQEVNLAIDKAKLQGTVNLGAWDASTNTPTITEGVGTQGHYYDVAVAGTFGGENFIVGDYIKCDASKHWYRVPTGIETDNPIVVAYIDQNSILPTTRPSGSPLKIGDYVKVKSTAVLPFDIGGIHIDNYGDIIEWNGTVWQLIDYYAGKTDEIAVKDKTTESLSGNSTYQNAINVENVAQLKKVIQSITLDSANKKLQFTKYDNTKYELDASDTAENNNNLVMSKAVWNEILKSTDCVFELDTTDTTKDKIHIKLVNNAGTTIYEARIDLADLLVLQNKTQELKNKTVKSSSIDVDENTLSNVEVDNFKASAIQKKTDTLSDSDTQLPTSALVKKEIDNVKENLANFVGAFNTYADLIAYSGEKTNNDYAVVGSDETHSNQATRYIYRKSTTSWEFQYVVNRAPLTQAQLDALNSNITATKVAYYDNPTFTIAATLANIVSGEAIATIWGKVCKAINDFIDFKSKLLTAFQTTPDNEHFISEKLAKDELDKKQDIFQFSTMPTASASYVGKIVQYIGTTTTDYINGYFYESVIDGATYKWQPKSVQAGGGGSATDLSGAFINNAYNVANYSSLANSKIKCLEDLIFANFNISLTTAIRDKIAGQRKILELPALPTGYTYPSSIRLVATEPTGNITCMADKAEFWDSTGAEYVSTADAQLQRFTVKSYKPISAYVKSYALTTDTTITAGKKYYTQHGNATDGYTYVEVKTPVVAEIDTYYEATLTAQTVGWEQELITINKNSSSVTAYVIDFTKGYKGVYAEAYDSSGNLIDNHGGNFIGIKAVSLTFDAEYVRKCLTIAKGCFVDESGYVGKWDCTPNTDHSLKVNCITSGTKALYGFSGTCTHTKDSLAGNDGEVECGINASREVRIKGDICLTNIKYRGLI